MADLVITEPKWSNPESTRIDCMVVFPQIGPGPVPFTASPSDIEEHGRLIFEAIVAGKCGPIGACVPPA